MSNSEDEQLFDDLVAAELGHYVYAFIDPATETPFYIGKGGGKSGAGNSRIFDHFKEARGETSTGNERIKKIRSIWETFGDVPWQIVRSGLQSEKEALLVESALIDMLRASNIELTNKQSGHGSAEYGMKSRDDLRAWRAPKLDPLRLPDDVLNRPIFVFNIALGVEDRREKFPVDSAELYEKATCQYWNVPEKRRALKGAMAIGCVNGITRVAVDVDRWEQRGDRWEIIPDHTEEGKMRREALTLKNVSLIINHCLGFWKRGNFLIVRFDSEKRIKVCRGSTVREIPFPSAAS